MSASRPTGSPAAGSQQVKTPYVLSDEAKALLEQIQKGKCMHSIMQLSVDKETCVIEPKNLLPFDGCSRADRVDRVLKLAKKEGPSLFVFRVDLKSNTPEWALLAWAPTATVSEAERVFYFTALSWLAGSMGFTRKIHEFYVTNEQEMPSFHWS
ncbi:hypothetical protein Efla_002102 [Eimeria flavescens]